jgi:hypothetical protein
MVSSMVDLPIRAKKFARPKLLMPILNFLAGAELDAAGAELDAGAETLAEDDAGAELADG